jgi:hypothetical protein
MKVKREGGGERTSSHPARKRHRPREQHGQDTQCDEREAQRAGEVDLESCSRR